jgi:hypothetical protein
MYRDLNAFPLLEDVNELEVLPGYTGYWNNVFLCEK